MIDAERPQNILVGAVRDLGIRKHRGILLDNRRILIHDHDVIPKLKHFFCQMTSEPSHSYDKYGFHNKPPYFPLDTISRSKPFPSVFGYPDFPAPWKMRAQETALRHVPHTSKRRE